MGKTETGETKMNPSEQLAKNHIRITRSLFNEGMRAVENPNYKKSIN